MRSGWMQDKSVRAKGTGMECITNLDEDREKLQDSIWQKSIDSLNEHLTLACGGSAMW